MASTIKKYFSIKESNETPMFPIKQAVKIFKTVFKGNWKAISDIFGEGTFTLNKKSMSGEELSPEIYKLERALKTVASTNNVKIEFKSRVGQSRFNKENPEYTGDVLFAFEDVPFKDRSGDNPKEIQKKNVFYHITFIQKNKDPKIFVRIEDLTNETEFETFKQLVNANF